MTYHSYAGVKKNFYTNEEFGYPQTYMMADIRALQHMYGADYGTNATNTEYKWDPNNGNTLVNGSVGLDPGANRIFATIWDGGGIDTYDLSAYATGVLVDLRPGRHSKFSEGQLADLGDFIGAGLHMAHGNIYNALLFKGNTASLIENAIGGAGNDRLIGNGANNVLTGNAGDDTFFFRDRSHQDTITDFGNGLDKINLADFDIRNFNALVNKMNQVGGDVEIRLGGGDILTLSGHLIADFDNADFIL
jgi:serralysin